MSTYPYLVQIRSPHHLGAVAKARRLELDWSQARLAAAAEVSRQWIIAFEAGKPTAELGPMFRTVRALGLVLDLVQAGRESIDLGEFLDG